MKKKLLTLSSLAVVSAFHSANGALLVDIFAGVDPTSASAWADAGVVEDLSAAAGGTINGSVFNISNLTATVAGSSGTFNGGAFSNPMLTDYLFNFGTMTISLGGFETAGVANTMTSSLGDMNGNSFTLATNTAYTLYLFGAGDQDGQEASFTFDGVSKATSPTIVGSAANAGHFVTFDLVTGSDLSGFTIDFSVDGVGGNNGAFNGLALVPTPVPEPSTGLLALGGLALGAMFTRRRKS